MTTHLAGPCTVTTKTLHLTAMRWLPDDQLYTAEVLAWLTATGAAYHCENGRGNARAKLVLTAGSDRVTCRPGSWIVREPDNTFSVLSNDLFRRKHLPDARRT